MATTGFRIAKIREETPSFTVVVCAARYAKDVMLSKIVS
jgi:hypothetical protein